VPQNLLRFSGFWVHGLVHFLTNRTVTDLRDQQLHQDDQEATREYNEDNDEARFDERVECLEARRVVAGCAVDGLDEQQVDRPDELQSDQKKQTLGIAVRIVFLEVWVVLERSQKLEQTFENMTVQQLIAQEEDENGQQLLPPHEAVVVEVLS